MVECLRPVHQVVLQIIAPAFKKYFQQKSNSFTQIILLCPAI
ncbi:hypothetical protein HMPREF9425_0490 [Streptococcus vestibularis ATCC 49124]|uniref:Uncharacterized protein n=1 Tax=Streptococcus vestibularis ATCC 49124 TaxID=889206 RepID=A0ABP2KNU1_STRVE|nr:hypothetical protein HMPREF9425_0490 [Streptococcus vestibularis ATCC 49124]